VAIKHSEKKPGQKERTEPGLFAFYDIRSGNGADLYSFNSEPTRRPGAEARTGLCVSDGDCC